MKKIGKEVLFLSTGEGNPRNGEGAFIRLKDGGILYAYTEYYGDSWVDHATARISGCYSYDEGESWTPSRVLIEKETNQMNIMSVSLVRCADGALGILYLEKRSANDNGQLCMPIFRRSTDEGKSFGPPISCIDKSGYYVVNNDRVLVTKSGRLIFPAAYHGEKYYSGEPHAPAGAMFAYSDDDGRSWNMLPTELISPYQGATGLQEPGIYEYDDGGLWAWFRTGYGYQYQAFSTDGGITWSPAEPNLHFSSPDSPMQVKKLSNCSVAIFNPCGFTCMTSEFEKWGSPKRTPFVCAVSTDDCQSFEPNGRTCERGALNRFSKSCYLLEDDLKNSYCYPAVMEVKDGFLVAYYHSNNSDICLNSTKISKVYTEEILPS